MYLTSTYKGGNVLWALNTRFVEIVTPPFSPMICIQKKNSGPHSWLTIYDPGTVKGQNNSGLSFAPFFYDAKYFLGRGLHSLGKLPVCLWGVISSPPSHCSTMVRWRKGHPQVSSSPVCRPPSSCQILESHAPSLSLHPSVSPVFLASGIFVSLPHCGCK